MNQQLQEDIKTILCASGVNVELAYIFGSVAKGCAHANSDIDIAVLARGLDSDEKIRLWQEISAVAQRPVDWVDLSTAGVVVIHQALQGLRIIGSVEMHAQLLTRMLIDQADFGVIVEKILKDRREAWLSKE